MIRTCSALAELGFSDITMYETLTRTHDPTPIVAPDVGTAIARIEEVENKKERRREGQIMDAARRREEKKRQREAEAAAAEAAEGTAAGAGIVAEVDGTTPAPLDAASEPVGPETKRVKRTATTQDLDGDETVGEELSLPQPDRASDSRGPDSAKPPAPAVDKTAEGRRLRDERDRDRDFGTKAGAYTRGHTSFLTFAVLLPLVDGISQRHAPSATAETAELAPLPVDASTEPSA